MIIVDRTKFLAMPENTIFSKYSPVFFDGLEIKGATMGNDFVTQSVCDAVANSSSEEFFQACDDMQSGMSRPMDFDYGGRDGLFDADQLFAVFEPEDVRGLIAALQACLP